MHAARTPARRTTLWLVLLFEVNAAQQAAYVAGKAVQFTLPLWLVVLGGTPWPRPAWPRRTGLGIGLAFGLAVALLMLAVYFGWLRHAPLLAQTPAQLRHKLQQVDLATPARYLALAGFLVVAHSLLEEYYWRWFVFGQLRRLVPLALAVVLSSLAFMAHHIVVLAVYLPGRFWTAAVPFALAIAIGGAAWAWFYERSGTLYPSWLSHLVVDAAILLIGWDLLWPLGR
jgi:membrane protease YdiL (CAAX protease family)